MEALLPCALLLMLVLAAGCVLGLWLLNPWLKSRGSAKVLRLWVVVWTLGWVWPLLGWVLYFLTYWQVVHSESVRAAGQVSICLGPLLWIIAFALYRRGHFLVVLTLCGLLAASVETPIVLENRYVTPPSDQEMMARFERRQATLTRLVSMMQSDRVLASVSGGWVEPSDSLSVGVPQSRVRQYWSLLKGAELRSVSADDGRGNIEFVAWGIGNALSSDSTKGYVYCEKVPARLLPTLDGYQPQEQDDVVVYRHIRGHWYLFYEHIPG
jgi:hypothetical protein